MAKARKSSDVDLTYLGDDKLAKGKKKFVDSTLSSLKGGNREERKDAEKEKKQKAKTAAIKQTTKGSWKKQVGGLVALLMICGAGLFQFLSTMMGLIMGSGVTVVDAADTAKLKEVLFGGEPWLVYCTNKENENQRLPKVLEDSARALRSRLSMQVATLRCWDKMESGRSVADRFKMKKSPPLSFVVANGNKPRKLDFVGVNNAAELEKKVEPALKIETYAINTLKKWPSLCTTRKTCVVIGHKKNAQRDTALGAIRPLLKQHRAVKVVTLDTSFWQLKLSDTVLETRGKQGGADILCLSRNEGKNVGNRTHDGLFMQELGQAANFMKACANQQGLVPLAEPPRIKARPSKPKQADPAPAPRPPPPTPRGSSPSPPRRNVDQVGSRQILEEQEPLFEAIDEDEEGFEGEGEDEEDEGDEVEL